MDSGYDPTSRKRPRNHQEDETSEFTPLSKRINNLHINNFSLVNNEEMKQEMQAAMLNGRLLDFEAGSSRNIDANLETEAMRWNTNCYNPDLTPSENPYYYESNRLLYELYLERSQRTNM